MATVPVGNTLLRRGLYLEYATLGWNVVGAAVVLAAAAEARSVALAGVGRDRERTALRLIGGAFVALALYVLAQAAYTLAAGVRPRHSPGGIAWLAATVVAMFLLAWGKRATGRRLGNPVLTTEARVTVIDGVLAAAVLAGLALNALVGWWWADPLAGLVIVYYGVKEGWHAWHDGAA